MDIKTDSLGPRRQILTLNFSSKAEENNHKFRA